MFPTEFINRFRIREEKEDYDVALKNIDNAINFRGTNLWILIFAIFIASLGLNVNSTAVIIGAMLISPLMGPIMGMGLAVAINDLKLLRKAWFNLVMAALVGLSTSTLYFLITPLNEAHAELLARTSPTIYDVLIALFGGFAGTLATFSKQKGNVIPGAAIATALMPPLCTAGYGLSTLNWHFFFGAFYLFIINAVFIASAALATTRLLKFPHKEIPDPVVERKTRRIIAVIVLFTLLPSVYFGYDIVQQDRFTRNATLFIEHETSLQNDYLLNKKINPKKKEILLVFGGKKIADQEIEMLKGKLAYYDLQDASLQVHQGFAYLGNENKIDDAGSSMLTKALAAKEAELDALKLQIDSIRNQEAQGQEIFQELQAQYPNLSGLTFSISSNVIKSSGTCVTCPLISLQFKHPYPAKKEQTHIINWLRIRMKHEDLKVIFE